METSQRLLGQFCCLVLATLLPPSNFPFFLPRNQSEGEVKPPSLNHGDKRLRLKTAERKDKRGLGTGAIRQLVLTEPARLRAPCATVKSGNLGLSHLQWNAVPDTRRPVRMNASFNVHCHGCTDVDTSEAKSVSLWHLEKKGPCLTSIPCMLVTCKLNSSVLSGGNHRSPTSL